MDAAPKHAGPENAAPEHAAPEHAASESTELSALFWLIAAGDHVAFARLYENWSPLLYALSLRITGDPRLASEALHAALLQIWRGQASHNPAHGTPEGWLVTHLRTRAIELMRQRQREGQLPEIFSRNADVAAGLTRLAALQGGESMAAALTKLDRPGQEILTLAYLDGLRPAELAQKLRLPIGTIRDTARRSLETLRTSILASSTEPAS